MRIILLLLLFVSFGTAPDALAQKAFSHCKQAEHTGDILTCLSKQKEISAARLKMLYETIQAALPIDKLEEFRHTQIKWIEYRDRECAWEVDQIETESLRRVEELSCLITLTTQRSAVLEALSTDTAQAVPERGYESFPRWMNVVAGENADVFWQYGDYLTVDLDCDGQSEEVMLGQTIKLRDVRVEDQPAYIAKNIISIAENPATGKPQSTQFFLDAMVVDDTGETCDPNLTLTTINYPDFEQSAEDDQATDEVLMKCEKALKVQTGSCTARTLFWDGAAYRFDPPFGE